MWPRAQKPATMFLQQMRVQPIIAQLVMQSNAEELLYDGALLGESRPLLALRTRFTGVSQERANINLHTTLSVCHCLFTLTFKLPGQDGICLLIIGPLRLLDSE